MVRGVIEIESPRKGTQESYDGCRMRPAEKDKAPRLKNMVYSAQKGLRINNVFKNIEKSNHIKKILR